nr:MAG TPA: hypothetical protein [Caudoviricetes sp.]
MVLPNNAGVNVYHLQSLCCRCYLSTLELFPKLYFSE